jgi:hypothetical protein
MDFSDWQNSAGSYFIFDALGFSLGVNLVIPNLNTVFCAFGNGFSRIELHPTQMLDYEALPQLEFENTGEFDENNEPIKRVIMSSIPLIGVQWVGLSATGLVCTNNPQLPPQVQTAGDTVLAAIVQDKVVNYVNGRRRFVPFAGTLNTLGDTVIYQANATEEVLGIVTEVLLYDGETHEYSLTTGADTVTIDTQSNQLRNASDSPFTLSIGQSISINSNGKAGKFSGFVAFKQ